MSDTTRQGDNDLDFFIFCNDCAHLHDPAALPDKYTCEAYPEGVPEEVAFGVLRHDEALEGDHGVQFDPLPGREGVAEIKRKDWEGKLARAKMEAQEAASQ